MEQKLGNGVDVDVDAVTDDPTKIQNVLSQFALFGGHRHHLQHRQNPVDGCDGHRKQKQDQEEGKQPPNEAVALRIDRVGPWKVWENYESIV